MNSQQLTDTSSARPRGTACVVLAVAPGEPADESLLALQQNTPSGVELARCEADTASVNALLARCSAADVVLVSEPCLVGRGWLERLQQAARADANTATASALCDVGTELATGDAPLPVERFERAAEDVARRSPASRPGLSRPVAPCVLLRREALELAGPLDEQLDLGTALDDFAQRCVLAGLGHVAADDVLAGRLAGADDPSRQPPWQPAAVLLERYPHLRSAAGRELATSAELEHSLAAVRAAGHRVTVTIDARALDGAATGTHVHILELIEALAHSGAVRLRVLIRERRIDEATRLRLRSLEAVELLAEERLDQSTPRDDVFHRPQQMFADEDVELALRLGRRLVLSQLDLIAYRNPGYFPDAESWAAFRRAGRHGMAAAERVLVFSEQTRSELLADGLVARERIAVVAPGLDHRTTDAPSCPTALGESAAGEQIARGELPFLMCLGTDFRHKNRVFALQLLAALRRRHGWNGALVLAGTHISHGSSAALERELLAAAPELRDAVVELGPVSESEKEWLLGEAAAVVYPSVYEGFGLVPFESALQGVPCLYAATSSLAEVAPEEAAALVPWDPAASADRCHAILADPLIRTSHVQALAARAAELTWATAAGRTIECYEAAAVGPVREAAVLSRDVVAHGRELTAAHEAVVERLIAERAHAQRMYDELNAEVGSGLALIGPHGSLPEDVQRALLTVAQRPALGRSLYGVLGRAFRVGRMLRRLGSRRS